MQNDTKLLWGPGKIPWLEIVSSFREIDSLGLVYAISSSSVYPSFHPSSKGLSRVQYAEEFLISYKTLVGS